MNPARIFLGIGEGFALPTLAFALFVGSLVIFGPAIQGSVALEGSKPTAAGNWVNADASIGELPVGFKVGRYTRLWERNPFTSPSDAAPEPRRSALDSLYLISWLIERDKEVIYVQNSQTNEVQRITTRPNDNNLRLVRMHLNSNPRLVDAIVAAGEEQGIVKVQADLQVASGITSQELTKSGTDVSSNQLAAPSITTSRLYPGIPKVHTEGDHPRLDKHSKFGPKANASVPGQN